MKNPGLILRCEMVGGRLEYDYVSSCEFETGDHTKSLKRIFKKGIRSGSCVVSVGGKSAVVFMVAGRDFVFTDYRPYLQQLTDNSLPLWEKTYFDEIIRKHVGFEPVINPRIHTNVWFDIENDVLWTLTRDNLEVLVSTLMSIKRLVSPEN